MPTTTYQYHHIGLPTLIPKKNEEYNAEMKFFASGYFESEFGIEWLRFEDDTPIHPLIKTVPHVAFVVPNMQIAIKGEKVIYGPSHPANGVTVCFIVKNGAPIEFLEFEKPEQEIWPNATKIVSTCTENGRLKFSFQYFGIPSAIKRDKEFVLNNFQSLNPRSLPHTNGIQWMRFHEDSSIPEVVQKTAHIAFQVTDLDEAIKSRTILVNPYIPAEGVRVAFIIENDVPIGFFEIHSFQSSL